LPGALSAALGYLHKHTDCIWLAGDTVYFDTTGIIQRCIYGPYWNTWLMKQTIVCNMINGPSSIFHHTLYDAAGGFDKKLHYAMDMELWFKFVDLGARFHRLHQYMWGFRIHEGSKTSHSIGAVHNDDFKHEVEQVILHANRKRTKREFLFLKFHKLFRGTHFRTLFDTWRWRGTAVEYFVNSKRKIYEIKWLSSL